MDYFILNKSIIESRHSATLENTPVALNKLKRGCFTERLQNDLKGHNSYQGLKELSLAKHEIDPAEAKNENSCITKSTTSRLGQDYNYSNNNKFTENSSISNGNHHLSSRYSNKLKSS
jgi:hypothetical protein